MSREVIKAIALPVFILVLGIVGAEWAAWTLCYAHWSEMAHGDFWQGNTIVVAALSGIAIVAGLISSFVEYLTAIDK